LYTNYPATHLFPSASYLKSSFFYLRQTFFSLGQGKGEFFRSISQAHMFGGHQVKASLTISITRKPVFAPSGNFTRRSGRPSRTLGPRQRVNLTNQPDLAFFPISSVFEAEGRFDQSNPPSFFELPPRLFLSRPKADSHIQSFPSSARRVRRTPS